MDRCNWSKIELMSKVLLVSKTKADKSTISQENLMLIAMFIRLFWLLDNLSCWVDSDLDMRTYIFMVWTKIVE